MEDRVMENDSFSVEETTCGACNCGLGGILSRAKHSKVEFIDGKPVPKGNAKKVLVCSCGRYGQGWPTHFNMSEAIKSFHSDNILVR